MTTFPTPLLCILERSGTKAAKGREIAMQDTSDAT